MNDVVDSAAPAAPGDARVAYVPAGSLVQLLLKNFGLTLVTLGIYRFWAKTELRRFFWSSIRIGDTPLEYTGRGIELFIGFLIIIGVFIAFAGIQALSDLLALTNPVAAGIIKILDVIALLLLIQVAIFRARRYRLSRTLWRGIRAGQDGSSWRYLGLAVGYGLLSLVTLGLATPWARVALERYIWTNTRFGDRHFSFEARGTALLPTWLKYYVCVLAVIALAAVVLYSDIAFLVRSGDPKNPLIGSVIGRFVGFYFLLLLVGGLGFIVYRVAEFRYFASCTRLGGMTFASTASGWRIAIRPVLFFLGVFVVLLVVIVPIMIVWPLPTPGKGAPPSLAVSDFAIGLVTAIIFYAISYVLSFLWLYVPVLKHLCRTFEVRNIAAADAIVQSTAPAPRFGEGLADAFDVGVI